uniref:Putative secreted protein n=1 Tax=Ixodes ricinus TaxID=34613 RepID=A0A6B0UJY5_IXORI
MLPISKMELVVFAVVLILPALLRGGFLSGTEMNDCMEILADCGEMKCLLEGSGNFSNFDPQYCTFICEGRPTPPLPRRICSGNKIVSQEEILSLHVGCFTAKLYMTHRSDF